MGQSRRDKVWPVPRATRHVWIRQPGVPPVAPIQGYVLDWRRQSYKWSGLVVYVASDGKVIQEWLPASMLSPVRVRPNDMPGNG